MRKIFFVTNKGNVLGGVFYVNKTLAEQFIKDGNTVHILSCRNGDYDVSNLCSKKIILKTINEKDKWEITTYREIFNELKKNHINKFFSMINKRKNERKLLKEDFNKLSNYILNEKPDVIIVSHYQMLDAIPKNYLKKVIFVQHSSFEDVLKYRVAPKVIKAYDKKIAVNAWLCQNSCEKAIEYGVTNSTYIYNPVRFTSSQIANVRKNKKLVTISRLDSWQKRIDLMVKAVSKIFKDERFREWELLLYGNGTLDTSLMDIINNTPQIKLMGITNEAEKVLSASSIYLSTSYMEGFSMSILEANECGISTIAYNFGESCCEQIIENKTGKIIDFDNEEKFIEELKNLMLDLDLLEQLSKNSKEFSRKHHVEEIAKEWYKVFAKIEKKELMNDD